MLGPLLAPAASRMILREDLLRRECVVLLERVRCWSVFWWARVRARRREPRWRARSSAEGSSPKMKNLMKKKRIRAMESWPRRKPWVKERLEEGGLVGLQKRERISVRRALGWG